MQIKEQQLEEQELQRKVAKDQAEAASKAEQLQVERERIASQERIATEQINAKIVMGREEMDLKETTEMLKIGNQLASSGKNQPVKKGNE
jgi:hypothetical protein